MFARNRNREDLRDPGPLELRSSDPGAWVRAAGMRRGPLWCDAGREVSEVRGRGCLFVRATGGLITESKGTGTMIKWRRPKDVVTRSVSHNITKIFFLLFQQNNGLFLFFFFSGGSSNWKSESRFP